MRVSLPRMRPPRCIRFVDFRSRDQSFSGSFHESAQLQALALHVLRVDQHDGLARVRQPETEAQEHDALSQWVDPRLFRIHLEVQAPELPV